MIGLGWGGARIDRKGGLDGWGGGGFVLECQATGSFFLDIHPKIICNDFDHVSPANTFLKTVGHEPPLRGHVYFVFVLIGYFFFSFQDHFPRFPDPKSVSHFEKQKE